LRPEHEKVLRYKLTDAFGTTWSQRGSREFVNEQIEKYKDIVIQCCRDDKYVSFCLIVLYLDGIFFFSLMYNSLTKKAI